MSIKDGIKLGIGMIIVNVTFSVIMNIVSLTIARLAQ